MAFTFQEVPLNQVSKVIAISSGMLAYTACYCHMHYLTGAYCIIGGEGVPATGTAGEWGKIDVSMIGGGEHNISVEITGPSKPEVNIEYPSAGSATINYRLMECGEYFITILYNKEPITGSPFKTVIQQAEGMYVTFDLTRKIMRNLMYVITDVGGASCYTCLLNQQAIFSQLLCIYWAGSEGSETRLILMLLKSLT